MLFSLVRVSAGGEGEVHCGSAEELDDVGGHPKEGGRDGDDQDQFGEGL